MRDRHEDKKRTEYTGTSVQGESGSVDESK